jgi:DNA helicase-2/ATP-dependent DNA helicase PcrA
MTRARDELHLIEPLRDYVTQQAAGGDRHVYGARSRFLDDSVLATLDRVAWPEEAESDAPPGDGASVRIDVGARLRALW